ncbi:uncharacterized protein ACA1_184390 [Acanthamoeba castellanii str. Neff]|uniref:Uncharacterized protein n=1 Tax=Acanthamoeba castellanii (strain ATCC 30010 / Neff) TaxID=1257118 RepID=L8H8D1_ACACF|nr:uncharacterized protein ACA1_184390 [Acanthamoeba castellanii str. Neff]ELR21492.1 hypothetical protein ACA1_184390 [Acanthamoeba castellanii str. Neff]
MAGKLDRVAKRQKLTQGQLDTKMITSPSSSPSSFTSTSPSTSSSSPPPRLFADWLKGVRLSTATSAHIHVRVLSSRPSSNLLSCLADQPWLIERVVPLSELRLPKHRFPAGIEPYLSAGLRPGQKVPATLVTGFNDQCCNLFKYSREELEGLNALRLYSRSVWEVLPAIAEVVFSKWPTTDGPVYHFTTPMIDKQGGILCTECRWQGFYDLQGNFSWGVTVVDRWSGPFINHLEHHQQPPEPVEEAAPTSQPHHNPTNFVDHPPTLDDLLYSHFFQDDPPT